MTAEPSVERRQHQRFPLTTSVQFYHAPSQRDFPGRCSNISAGGMLLHVPAATPLQPGHSIRLDLGSVNRPEFANLGDIPIHATIVRVDRKALLKVGHLAIGVRFAQA